MNDNVSVAAAPEPNGANRKTGKRKIRGVKRSAFAFPYLALSIIFVVAPLVIMLYYAFTDSATGEFTGKNFAMFFNRIGRAHV